MPLIRCPRFLARSPRVVAAGTLVCLASLSTAASAGPSIIYVDANASGANDGSSWTDAYDGSAGLQAAIAQATAGTQIWLADGLYLPTQGAARTISFTMKNGVAIYGGFDGGEVTLDERDPATNVAILSGDLGGDDGGAPGNDNSLHVVRADSAAITNSSILSGVTVTGGNANAGGDPNDRGGAMLIINGADPVFEDVIFSNSRCSFGGGAGYVRNSSPSYIRCTFTGCDGGNFGGAFDIFSGGPVVNVLFDGCRVYDNRASRAGGIEAFGNVNVTLVNTVVVANTTGGDGGGVFVANGADAFMDSCTIADNSAGDTGGVHLTGGGTLAADNCIIAGNSDAGGVVSNAQVNLTTASLDNCLVTGGWVGGGTGSFDGDPMFLDIANGSGMIAAGSDAADRGNNLLVPAGLLVDVNGNPRFTDDSCATDAGTPGGAGGKVILDVGAVERISVFVDCNTNGIADECEIADGSVDDCDGNFIPDSCDIAAGADDCNSNGIVDSCEVAQVIMADSGVLSPFGNSAPQSFIVPAGGEAAGDVTIELEASGDFDLAFEIAVVSVNGTSIGNAFAAAGNCDDPASMDMFVLTAAEWNALAVAGEPTTISLAPNGAVDSTDCGGASFVQGTVSYLAAGSNDADLDGIPDDCVIDCTGDVNGSGAVDFTDLVILLGAWGDCPGGVPCLGDVNESGGVDFTDLVILLGAWGDCI